MIPVREQLLHRLGILPSRPDPRPAEIDKVLTGDGLVYERWIIAGPRGPIPAWFVQREAASRRLPALIALHPHGRQFEVAKSLVVGLVGDGSRAYGKRAAEAGFAVLAPDLLGFEDRRPSLRQRKDSYALQGEAYERLLGNQALVQGGSLQGWILADIACVVDSLALDPRVDVQRLAALGQSFGGQEVVFAMLFDERIQAGVASCGFSLLRLLVERNISHNMALYVPGLLPELDFDVLVPALAPRALRVVAGRQDRIYPADGVEIVERAARAAWQAAGVPERLYFDWFAGPHDLPPEQLQSALQWLQEVV